MSSPKEKFSNSPIVRNPDFSEQSYLQVIYRKTAMLFQAASHTAAVLAGANQATETALRDFGLHLGLAFQLIDDMLDYAGNAQELGKNVGDDLAEGKVTLPLIIAMRNSDKAQANFIRETILAGGTEQLPSVIEMVRNTGGLRYTMSRASMEQEKAMQCINMVTPSKYRNSMENLVKFTIERSN